MRREREREREREEEEEEEEETVKTMKQKKNECVLRNAEREKKRNLPADHLSSAAS